MCLKKKKFQENGTMHVANVKIGNDELDQFVGMKGFELCTDKDILLINKYKTYITRYEKYK